MPRTTKGEPSGGRSKPATLKTLADHLGLSPAAVSLVLNDAPGAAAIPEETKRRVLRAAKELEYRPNPIARSLRSQRTHTIGVLLPGLTDPFSAQVLGGVEDYLLHANYFFFIASHGGRESLVDEYLQLFAQRRVEGLILVDTRPRAPAGIPIVAVSCHEPVEGVTRIVLDNERAARLALEHLLARGHRRIAFLQGHHFISDAVARWRWIRGVAAELGAPIDDRLVVRLDGEVASPEPGYLATKALLRAGEPFTAIFAFNDTSAIGAIRALAEAGLRVPEEVSVVGFDDWQGAAFHNPPLTTIRQPLAEMGRLAAETVLQQRQKPPRTTEIMVEPELIVRGSTGTARSRAAIRRRRR